MQSTQQPLCSAPCTVKSFCINCCTLQRDASLDQGECSNDPWVEGKYLEGSLTTCPFSNTIVVGCPVETATSQAMRL